MAGELLLLCDGGLEGKTYVGSRRILYWRLGLRVGLVSVLLLCRAWRWALQICVDFFKSTDFALPHCGLRCKFRNVLMCVYALLGDWRLFLDL